ncbi:MAG: SapC family protein [Woeseia sp.]
MSEKQAKAADNSAPVPFLFQQPELLTLEEHAALGIAPQPGPYNFAAEARAVPLTLPELAAAQKDYPVVFTNMETPYLVAVLGVLEDRNLFVQDGLWEEGRYVPAYLRCYPFIFAGEQNGRIAVALDRAAACVSDKPQQPFFVDGKLTQRTEELMRFCAQYEAERRRTAEFCTVLKDMGLLCPQQSSFTRAGSDKQESLANYVSIDSEKLAQLDDDSVLKLHRSGRLAAAYLQLYSLENWQSLVERRAALLS